MRTIAIALVALALVACDDADEPTSDATMTADATSAADSTSSTTEDATSADAQEDTDGPAVHPIFGDICTDADGDESYIGPECPLPTDCSDFEPDRWPGNQEICDGKDNDCNGMIDDGVTDCP